MKAFGSKLGSAVAGVAKAHGAVGSTLAEGATGAFSAVTGSKGDLGSRCNTMVSAVVLSVTSMHLQPLLSASRAKVERMRWRTRHTAGTGAMYTTREHLVWLNVLVCVHLQSLLLPVGCQ